MTGVDGRPSWWPAKALGSQHSAFHENLKGLNRPSHRSHREMGTSEGRPDLKPLGSARMDEVAEGSRGVEGLRKVGAHQRDSADRDLPPDAHEVVQAPLQRMGARVPAVFASTR